ncbi:MAG: glutathione binding-like protein, partial [Caulobacterales bacterium]
GGAPISVFESGAIMIYLAEKAGQFYSQDLRMRHEINQWVFWQMANQGPKSGECGHFRRLKPEAGDQSYAVRRFTDEVNRLFGVLNNRLYDRPYIAGDAYTIADMICYPWATMWKLHDQNIDEFSHVKRWLDELAARPALQRGMAIVLPPSEDSGLSSEQEKQRRESMLRHQRARPAPA